MNDIARMLDDTLQRLLRARLGDAQARGEPGLADALAADFVDAGLHLVMQPEEAGGMGGTIADVAAVAWRCGWHAAPLPVTEMLLLPTIDLEASVLAASIAHGNPASAPVLKSTTSVLVPGRAIAVDRGTMLTSLSQAPRVRLDGVGANWDDTVLMRGALLTAAAMTGAMARVLEIATEYVDTRVQFGRPLTKFQAIQHRMAEAASELAVTEAALAAALEAESQGRGRTLLWRSAKAQAGHAATVIASSAHQVLGAIGFTEEHELQHFTRRLWQWRDEWGRQADCQLAIGGEACADPAGLWLHICDQERVCA